MSESIALCLIVRNESANLRACVESFAGAFDELVVVDTGSTDDTKAIAASLGATVVDHAWRDDFSAARQMSFDMAKADWLIWADADERLAPGCASKIRQAVSRMGDQAIAYFKRKVGDFEIMERDSLIKRGSGRWVGRIHERFESLPGLKRCAIPSIVVLHPMIKEESHARNIKVLTEELSGTHRTMFYLAGEMYQKGDKKRAAELADAALTLGGLGAVERYELLMIQADAAEGRDARRRPALEAYALQPFRREALVFLTLEAIRAKDYMVALGHAMSLVALPKPPTNIWTLQKSWYGWQGADLLAFCLRLNGRTKEAEKVMQKVRGGQQPNITLVHATRGRPQKMVECRNLWMAMAKTPALVEHMFVLDADDHEAIEEANGYVHHIIEPGGGCVAAWNHGGYRANGKVIVQLSDDWIPPANWDALIMDRLANHIGKPAVLAVSDGIDRGGGWMTKCMCMAIMTLERLQIQGHMFHPSYRSVYSDNEFTDRAYEDGIVVEARDIVFKHKHYLTGEVEEDQTYKQQNAPERYRHGEAIYKKRKAARNSKAKISRSYAAMILTTGDDFMLHNVVARLQEEGVKHSFICVPSECWDGTPVAFDPKGNDDVTVIKIDVAKHRAPGLDVLMVEAAVRNEALEQIRGYGWEHVVVADDDELWVHGTLRAIDDYVDDNFPPSLCMGMVPVIGVPGYPVQGAQDVAMVYLGPGTKFFSSRSAEGFQRMYPVPLVLHFSACRKTLDEVIAKSRKSGHYGDPDYDFEGWIHGVLPNIKPGMKRVHMFRKWDTWPLVREWSKHELESIPDNIKPFLGGMHVLSK